MIEDAFSARQSVAVAAATGRPDAHAGEVPMAYVQLRPGMEVEADTPLAFARDRIAERAAIPREVIILPSLPIIAVGEVHKQTLSVARDCRASMN